MEIKDSNADAGADASLQADLNYNGVGWLIKENMLVINVNQGLSAILNLDGQKQLDKYLDLDRCSRYF